MNRTPAWDGPGEKWTEYEHEVLWFEQNLRPSERPQLVGRLFKALSGPGKKALQSESAKTFAGKDAEHHLEFLDLGNKLDDFFLANQASDGRDHGKMEHKIRWCVPAITLRLETSNGKKNQSFCAQQLDADYRWRTSRGIRSGRRFRRHSFRGYCRVSSVVGSSRITSIWDTRMIFTSSGRVWNDAHSTLTFGIDGSS